MSGNIRNQEVDGICTEISRDHFENSTEFGLQITTAHNNNKIIFLLNNDVVDNFHAKLAYTWQMTDAHKVKQFTEESMGVILPEKPIVMSHDSVKFLISMVMSEMVELAQTVCNSPLEALGLVYSCAGKDLNLQRKPPVDDMSTIAEQSDAMVDAWYYMLNAAAKHGVNLSQLFARVHAANMDKKFPDGQFHRREDSKVIKPPGWCEPDVVGAIEQQFKNGAW